MSGYVPLGKRMLKMIGIKPDDPAVLEARAHRGELLSRLIGTQLWREGMIPLLEQLEDEYTRIVVAGTERDMVAMDKIRGRLEMIRELQRKLEKAIKAGIESKIKLDKLKGVPNG